MFCVLLVMQPTRTVVMCNTTFDQRENSAQENGSMLDIVWFMNLKFPVQVKYLKKPRHFLSWLQLQHYPVFSLVQVLRREKLDVPLLTVPFTTLAATLPTPLEPVIPALAPVLPALAPAVSSLSDLQQPPLMGNVDPTKVDEIRRTIYVGNLNSQTATAEQLLEFFKPVGDVRFVRMAGDETQPTRFAFVEFSDQNSVIRALTFNGVMFGDRPLK
ncbi:unnamed protein product [Ranitomeya imitator]|uniref:RRM domain-containing protein n=1 Tax=Ranitomeya imitator TaxID=111125 RepID=A0ABN9KTB1_9NEOB|nr:unnamed protein product [Ranitomeya imitator]